MELSFSWSFLFSFAEDEFVVEEKIENHNDDGSEDKSTGGESKIIRKWNMERLKNIESKLIKWSDETEKLGEYWDDGECE